MKKYNKTVYESGIAYGLNGEEIPYTDESDVFVCEISMSDMEEINKEFSAYMKKSGKIYSFDWNKEPTERQFFKLFFGDMDDEIYIVPSWYICQDEKTTNMFYNIAKNLKYHDKFNQVYCDVEKDGNTIKVMYGDY